MPVHYPLHIGKVWQYTCSIQGEIAKDTTFSMLPVDTIYIPLDSDTTRIVLSWSGPVHLFGKDRRQWMFDEEETHWITDSISLTKWVYFAVVVDLNGAIINGVHYGNFSEVN
ncbi:MAG: hypothetical protein ACE5GL_02615 [Calditrichia bacterium]